MIPYILHVTVIITVCFLFYKILLQKETFYRLNRWTLMACLAVSFALPLLPAPRQWSWRNSYENVLAGLFANAEPGEPAASPRPEKPPVQQPTLSAPSTFPIQPTGPTQPTASAHPNYSARSIPHSRPITRRQRVSSTLPSYSISSSIPTTSSLSSEASPASPATGKGALSSQATGKASLSSPAPSHQPAVLSLATLAVALRWLFYLYCFGVIIFGANFLLQIIVLLYQSYRSPVIRDGRFRIVETSGDRAPCSFGNNIFINPSAYDWETYNQILIHEKIHVSGRHTFDILLAEIVVVLQWFNPFAWLYRKEVENNLEFLTDQSVLLHQQVERSAYQLSLLRVSAPHLPFSITTNYNQSLLKRRIVMMNSQHSSLRTVWKYFFLIPVLTVLVCALNKPAVFGQSSTSGNKDQPAQRNNRPGQNRSGGHAASNSDSRNLQTDTSGRSNGSSNRHSDPDDVSIDPVTTTTVTVSPVAHTVTTTNLSVDVNGSGRYQYRYEDADQTSAVHVTSSPNVRVRISNEADPDNSPDAISSTNTVNAYTRTTVHNVVIATPYVSTQNVSVDIRQDETEGSWFVTTADDKLEFELKGGSEYNNWSNTFRVEKSEINPFPGQGNVEFKIVREAGTIVFKGQFDGQQGFGHYKFTADESFFNFLKQQGIEDTEEGRRWSFFSANVKKDYVSMLIRNGFTHISRRDLVSMASLHIDEDYIKSWKKTGYDDLTERDLVSAKSMHIDPAYVQEIKAAGYDHLSMRELTSLKSQHIDGQYIRSFHTSKGSELPPVRDLISFKSAHIDSGYLDDLKKLGYSDLSYRDLISLHSMNITPDFIKGYQAAGYKDIPARSLITLKSMNISPDFIKGFKDIGYTNIELRDLTSLKSMNVTPDFVKGFKDMGYVDIELRELSSLKSTGVTPAFAKDFQSIGYDHVPLRELRSLKAMGIDAAYVSKMKEKGFDSKDLNKYIRLKNAFQ